MLLALILLNLLAACANGNTRQRRYLVYPDGGPARTQDSYNLVLRQEGKHHVEISGNLWDFIIGLGVPVDLKEASVTVGTVIKFQYDLPTNSTEYTSRIFGFANTVSRDMDSDITDVEEETNLDADGLKNISDEDSSTRDNQLDHDSNDSLVDITFDDRRKRALLYSEGGFINDIDDSDVATEIPLQEAIRRQELIDEKHAEENPEPQRMNRWDFYKIIEHMMERYGYSGRPCLLRTICEAAEVPFTYEHGLLGEIGHILFTPSTTKDVLSHHTDNEYHAAERLGRDISTNCESLFPECESSILDTFTGIGIDTLHKFGLK